MRFFLGFLLGLSVISCAALPTFNYKFFHISGNSFSGTLQGPKEADDLPFERCRPVNGKQQCVVVFYTELTAIIADFKKTKQDLINCQKGIQ